MSRDQYHICPSGKWNLASPRSCVTTVYTILLRAASESETDINIFQGHKPHAALRLSEVASKLRNKINNSLIMLHDFVLRQVANHVKKILWKGYCTEKLSSTSQFDSYCKIMVIKHTGQRNKCETAIKWCLLRQTSEDGHNKNLPSSVWIFSSVWL